MPGQHSSYLISVKEFFLIDLSELLQQLSWSWTVTRLFPLGKTTFSDYYLDWGYLFVFSSFPNSNMLSQVLFGFMFLQLSFQVFWCLVFYLKTAFGEFMVLLFSYYLLLQRAIEWLIGFQCWLIQRWSVLNSINPKPVFIWLIDKSLRKWS